MDFLNKTEFAWPDAAASRGSHKGRLHTQTVKLRLLAGPAKAWAGASYEHQALSPRPENPLENIAGLRKKIVQHPAEQRRRHGRLYGKPRNRVFHVRKAGRKAKARL
ncbi:MAG TPA: hypothetical protein PKH09_00085 [Parvularculaceae bacterium]|nr:hypothetical protein [Parvularculaceae bacterium]